MLLFPIFIPLQPPQIKKSDLESTLLKIPRNIVASYTMLAITFIVVLSGMQLFFVPFLVANSYTDIGLTPPFFSTIVTLLGIMSNIWLLFAVHTAKNYLNQAEVRKLRSSTAKTVTIYPYTIEDPTLAKYYALNTVVTLLSLILAIFLPLLLHPNFPNI